MSNPPAVIDPEAFTVSRTITIAAEPEKVWTAITEPDHIARWFGSAATLDRVAVGGRGAWTFEGYGDVPIVIEALEPQTSITYRWGSPKSPEIDPAASTAFTFTLAAVEGGTQLTVVEWGFDYAADPGAEMADHQEGWGSELDKLVAYLEGAAS